MMWRTLGLYLGLDFIQVWAKIKRLRTISPKNGWWGERNRNSRISAGAGTKDMLASVRLRCLGRSTATRFRQHAVLSDYREFSRSDSRDPWSSRRLQSCLRGRTRLFFGGLRASVESGRTSTHRPEILATAISKPAGTASRVFVEEKPHP